MARNFVGSPEITPLDFFSGKTWRQEKEVAAPIFKMKLKQTESKTGERLKEVSINELSL